MKPQSPFPLQRLIDRYEAETKLIFLPSKDFYNDVGVNQKRFGMIAKGKIEPLFSEVDALVKFFNRFFPITLNEFLK